MPRFMNSDHELLIDVLSKPARLADLSSSGWDIVIRLARRSNLLGRLAHLVEDRGLSEQIPLPVRGHLRAVMMLSDNHARVVNWEIDRIQQALDDLDIPLVLLKGAGYVLAGLSCGRGRLFNDIDILVPKTALPRVEQALKLCGWISTHHDSYDQRYYRTWMHELPPLIHAQRRTVLDVHHAIIPETSRLSSSPAPLFESAIGIEGRPGLQVLSPEDRILHSAAHLFLEGDFDQGLRDLVDLDTLVRDYIDRESSWTTLVARAQALNLELPLYYALRYTNRILGTPVPEDVQHTLDNAGPGARLWLMDALFRRGLAPRHESCADWFTGRALWLLYVRAHYLRMPLHLLLPHLVRKSLRPAR